MPAPRKYPLELRDRAVRMYRAAEPKPVIRRMAEELGVHHEALRTWIRQADADAGERDGLLTTVEREELVALRKENARRTAPPPAAPTAACAYPPSTAACPSTAPLRAEKASGPAPPSSGSGSRGHLRPGWLSVDGVGRCADAGRQGSGCSVQMHLPVEV